MGDDENDDLTDEEYAAFVRLAKALRDEGTVKRVGWTFDANEDDS